MEQKFKRSSATMQKKLKEVLDLYKEKTQKECYKIFIVDGEPDILDDKIGGDPYLPVGEEWPKDTRGNYMPLLLQVNLKNVALEGYPGKGILEIFTDNECNSPCEYEIRYFEEGLEYQKVLPKIDRNGHICLKVSKIKLEKFITHMPLYDYRAWDIVLELASKVYNQKIDSTSKLDSFLGDKWVDFLDDNIIKHPITIGGYADFAQFDPRESDLKNKEECLFKLDCSYDDELFCVGDGGFVFALISQKEIEKCEFKKAFVDWDCY